MDIKYNPAASGFQKCWLNPERVKVFETSVSLPQGPQYETLLLKEN